MSEPYNWWHSGLNWYCTIAVGPKTYVGAGKTRQKAHEDAVQTAHSAQRR